ncbi:MAG: leucine--tRNA ligase [Proteobacteria bacterium]|jgi:leucyl-tRNA synthetase|nr:leucine--tRNA ligase [Pseudomonadota bacterium]
MKSFDPAAIEASAQETWETRDVYRAIENDPRFPRGKYYCLSMLPYPSGKLHMGHVRNYTINDMMYRQLRMRGYNVLMPMGWDAFGLPAENAAMKSHEAPGKWTRDNIAYMKKQLKAMGFAIDWSRELATCDPSYYRWNQWLFLKMREAGIAYRRSGTVNWDPVDQTVLANEQVIDGRGWRSGAPVEKREIPMYYLRITKYADELLRELDSMPGWPERVKTMQANWIGRSDGVRFAFPHAIPGADGAPIGGGRLYVFTTRADTIMGVTFCAVAPEHPLAAHAASRDPRVAAFVDECRVGSVMEADLATMDKKGVPTGLSVRHPLTGADVDVWVGNYVLMGYGDGAVMGVPAHDERDFAFAKKYGLPIRQVIAPAADGGGGACAVPPFTTERWQPWYEDKAIGACIGSGRYDGLRYAGAVDAIAGDLAALGLGEKRTTWRLHDWGISRQRYWGTPIPIIHCGSCGEVPVPEKDLPVVLPDDCVPDGSGSPLARREDFLRVACPSCGAPARRETDTMDTFVDSSWYFMRYACPDASTMVDWREAYWMPVDQYIGGISHAILHLLYARFWTKVMRDMGLVGYGEPFTRLLTQGMVLAHAYFRRSERGGIDYIPPADVEPARDASGAIVGGRSKKDGLPVEYDGLGTMSKSKLNGVDPQEMVERYGADAARVFVMFASPPEHTIEWSDAGVEGAHRFLRRLWQFAQARGVREDLAAPDWREASGTLRGLRRELHLTLKQADYDYQRVQYNTVVSAGMKMLNALEGIPGDDRDARALIREGLSIALRVLYPVAPHTTWALWNELGYAATQGDLVDARWPEADPSALAQDAIELVLQVNGKLRGKLTVPSGAGTAAIEAAARAAPEVARHGGAAAIRKVVVVPGRLVNVVV